MLPFSRSMGGKRPEWQSDRETSISERPASREALMDSKFGGHRAVNSKPPISSRLRISPTFVSNRSLVADCDGTDLVRRLLLSRAPHRDDHFSGQTGRPHQRARRKCRARRSGSTEQRTGQSRSLIAGRPTLGRAAGRNRCNFGGFCGRLLPAPDHMQIGPQ